MIMQEKKKNKCVFLDRDGVLNKELGSYAFRKDHFDVIESVPSSLKKLKEAGYLLIVITNQAGIIKGLYKDEDVDLCHSILQESCGGLLDDLYFSPYHPDYTNSLSRKPKSLMWEKAIAKYSIDIEKSWMIGDKESDLIPAKSLGISTIRIFRDEQKPFETIASYQCYTVEESLPYILPDES